MNTQFSLHVVVMKAHPQKRPERPQVSMLTGFQQPKCMLKENEMKKLIMQVTPVIQCKCVANFKPTTIALIAMRR